MKVIEEIYVIRTAGMEGHVDRLYFTSKEDAQKYIDEELPNPYNFKYYVQEIDDYIWDVRTNLG